MAWMNALVLAGAALTAVLLVSRMLWHDGVQRRGDVPWAALACGLCVALTGPLVWSAAGAMEVPLFVLLVLAAVLAFSRHGGPPWRNGMLWGALAGLAGK